MFKLKCTFRTSIVSCEKKMYFSLFGPGYTVNKLVLARVFCLFNENFHFFFFKFWVLLLFENKIKCEKEKLLTEASK